MVRKGSIHCYDYDEDVFPCVQKCLLHYFKDMYRTTKENEGSEFSLLFMELYNILKDAIAIVGHESDGAVEGLKYQIHRLLSKEYEDKDCQMYLKRLKREGDSLFTFIMHDVGYHNNVSKQALKRFAAFRPDPLREQVRCRR